MNVFALPSLVSPFWERAPLPVVANALFLPGGHHRASGIWQWNVVHGRPLGHVVQVGHCSTKMVRAAAKEMSAMSRDAGCRHPSIGKTGFPDLLDRMVLASSRCACFAQLADKAVTNQTSATCCLRLTPLSSVKPTLPTSFSTRSSGNDGPAGRILKHVSDVREPNG